MTDELWRSGLFAHPPSVSDNTPMVLGRSYHVDVYTHLDADGFGYTVTVVK